MSGRAEQPRWSLTADSFERLLALLGPDRESAGRRYEEVRRRLARLFEWRGFANADDLVDATFDRVARKVEAGADVYASDPYSYLHGVALRVAQEQGKQAARERAAPEAALDARTTARWRGEASAGGERERDEGRLRCLDECLAALPPEGRSLLQRYHAADERIAGRRALARALGVSATALRLRAFRLRAALQQCVADCCRRTETEAPRTP